MADIYQAMEKYIGQRLSEQGRASLREVVNRYMVHLGYVEKARHRWHITPKGKEKIRISADVIDIEIFEGTDEEIDSLVKANRLRFGCVDTGDELAVTRRRRGQDRLRELTLTNYSSTCALCDVNDVSLLVTSHIVGWAEDAECRGFLSNIICLCKFHDALFEKGYLSLSDDLTILKKYHKANQFIVVLLDNTKQFRKPIEHFPIPDFLRRHRLRFGFKEL